MCKRFIILFLALAAVSCKKKDRFNKIPLATEYIQNDFEKAKEESTKNGKPILIVFYAKWCSLCTDMKNQTFNDPEAKAYFLENTVTVFLDVEEEPGKQVAANYNCKHLNQLLLNLDFSAKAKNQGKLPKDVFLDWVKSNL